MKQESKHINNNVDVGFHCNHLHEDSLFEKVKIIIKKIPDENLTLSEIVDLLGKDGLLLFAALLTVIFLIPVSIPGFSTVFGVIIFFIGLSILLNRSLWLPVRVKSKTVSAEKFRASLNKGIKWFRLLEKISKPQRLSFLIYNKIANKINGLFILIGSLLLMLPFGLLPFSNTLPAISILFLSIGFLQKDGIIIILGHLFLIGSFIYFGLFFSTILIAFKHIIETKI